jgi:hypothetical protein
MELPEDLKNYRADASFNLLTPQQAERLLLIVGLIAWIADMLGWLG